MNYHFKNKYPSRKKGHKTAVLVVILILVFLLLGLFGGGFSNITNNISYPFITLGNATRQVFSDLFSFVDVRSNLIVENRKYKSDIFKLGLELSDYSLVVKENRKLKEMLGISGDYKETFFAGILMSPPTTPNDILIINIGSGSKIKKGDFVAIGKIAVGMVSEVFKNTSKIKMFSTNGTEITGTIKNSSITVEGNGGGNFRVEVPKDLDVQINDEFIMENDYGAFVVGEVKNIEVKGSTYFKKILLSIPINILEAQMVQIFSK